jgi:hypothetical protein
LSRPTVFFIFKYAFLALSISVSIASPKLLLYFSTIPRSGEDPGFQVKNNCAE